MRNIRVNRNETRRIQIVLVLVAERGEDVDHLIMIKIMIEFSSRGSNSNYRSSRNLLNNVTSMQQAVLIVQLEPEEATRNTGYHGDY